MNIRVIIISLIWFNSGLYGFSQEVFTLKKKNSNKSYSFLKGENIAIRTIFDDDDYEKQLGNFIDSLILDTLYVTNYGYDELKGINVPFTKKIPISIIEEVGVVRGKKCTPTVAIFLGPAIILGGALGAIEGSDYNFQTLAIGAGIGGVITMATYFWIKRCSPKMLNIREKWSFVGGSV